nr:hypothetical protein L203_05614 [Cryptococcus depauperatus CBS 7841]
MSNPSYSPGYLAPPGYNTTVQPDDPASRSPSTTSQQTLASNAPTAQPVTSVESGSNVNLKETEDTEDTERRREQTNRSNGESATQTDTAVGGTVHRGTQTDSDGIVYTGHGEFFDPDRFTEKDWKMFDEYNYHTSFNASYNSYQSE